LVIYFPLVSDRWLLIWLFVESFNRDTRFLTLFGMTYSLGLLPGGEKGGGFAALFLSPLLTQTLCHSEWSVAEWGIAVMTIDGIDLLRFLPKSRFFGIELVIWWFGDLFICE